MNDPRIEPTGERGEVRVVSGETDAMGKPLDERTKAFLKEVREGPQLGLATTRQLLEELRVRGLVGKAGGMGDDIPADTRAKRYDHATLGAKADKLLRTLRRDTLDYRTVDGG